MILEFAVTFLMKSILKKVLKSTQILSKRKAIAVEVKVPPTTINALGTSQNIPKVGEDNLSPMTKTIPADNKPNIEKIFI